MKNLDILKHILRIYLLVFIYFIISIISICYFLFFSYKYFKNYIKTSELMVILYIIATLHEVYYLDILCTFFFEEAEGENKKRR